MARRLKSANAAAAAMRGGTVPLPHARDVRTTPFRFADSFVFMASFPVHFRELRFDHSHDSGQNSATEPFPV